METIERSIDLNVPVHMAYEQWTRFEEFPQFMEGVEEVQRLDASACIGWPPSAAPARSGMPRSPRTCRPAHCLAQRGGGVHGRRGDVPAARRPHAHDRALRVRARRREGDRRRLARSGLRRIENDSSALKPSLRHVTERQQDSGRRRPRQSEHSPVPPRRLLQRQPWTRRLRSMKPTSSGTTAPLDPAPSPMPSMRRRTAMAMPWRPTPGMPAVTGPIEAEARRDWEARHQGTWDELKDAVFYGWEHVRGPRHAEAGDVRIPIVEEAIHVETRQVERGGVRIYSHVTEQPVEQEVHLRDERVTVERRPVDRPATERDLAAFKEGTDRAYRDP